MPGPTTTATVGPMAGQQIAPPTADALTPPPGRRSWRGVLVASAAAVALALSAGTAGAVVGSLATADDGSSTAASAATSTAFDGDSVDVASVVDSLRASVVSVDTTVQTRQGPFPVEGHGAGTGVVIDDDGHVLTNAHVVEGATQVTITVDGSTRAATVVASDASADVAVLLVGDPTGLVAAPIADVVSVGDDVLAIGNALALEGDLTVTRGIVSAVGRSIETSNGTLEGLVQTDAAISSGNSGGPLVNARGEVVGINTAVASSDATTQASNVGFAISIDQALDVAEGLLARA